MVLGPGFSKSVKTITTKLPTFLHTLMKEDCNIRLTYCDKAPTSDLDVSVEEPLDLLSQQRLDLTGSPLQTDLGGNESMNMSTSVMVCPNWTTEEANYYPISLSESRSFMNKILRDRDLKGKPIFCICDGNDSDQTVILGTMQTEKTLTRILVNIFSNPIEEEMKMEIFFKDHSKNFNETVKNIDCVVTDVYYLLNQNLKNSNCLDASESSGSVALEVTQFGASEASKRTYKSMIQVIIGHNSSPLSSFWKELSLIEHCIDMLGTPEVISYPKTKFSNGNFQASDLISEICEALQSIKPPKNESSYSLNLENLRSENFMDILWNILRRCSHLDDLRNCFHAFFEELAATDTMISIVQEDDKSTLSGVIDDIFKGRRAVPTLNNSQSLELLVELGLEKLKRDYVTIITRLFPIIEETVLKSWNGFQAQSEVNNSNQMSKRKTRSTIAPNSAATDLAMSKQKLSFLYNLHVISEFMLLFKECFNTDYNFDDFAKNLYTKFMLNEGKKIGSNYSSFRKAVLLEFESDLNTFDHNILQGEISSSQMVKLASRFRSTDVITIYHISNHPIFPPSIWNYHHNKNKDHSISINAIIDDEIPSKYVTKFVQLITHR